MRKGFRSRVAGATLLTLALIATACGESGGDSTTSTEAPPTTAADLPTITIGSTNFYEQLILAEIYAQALEADGYPVERKFNLGPREVVNPALKSGEIDLIVEYTGTLLTFEGGTSSTDSMQTWEDLKEILAPSGLVALDYAPAQDKNGIVVTAETAADLGISKVSDLAGYNGQLIFGGPPECPEREFCLIGLTEVYGLEFADFKPLDAGGALTVAALEGGDIDVALLFTSDGVIAAKGFVLLEDDLALQPSENLVPVIREEILNAYGQDLADLLNPITAAVSTAELTGLNKRYALDAEDADALAAEWLAAHGF